MHGDDSLGRASRPAMEPLEPRRLLDAAWTVMVYLDADNNLEGAGVDDVNEMEVVGSTADVNVLVQFDRIPGHDAGNGDWTDTRRGRVVQDADAATIATPLTPIGEVNMGDPASLTDFIQWGVAAHPADRYAVVLWDHGGGTSGVCWDDTDGGDHLTVAEVGDALAGAGVAVDLLGFDACLMGMMEPAYEVRADAGVMVASEQTEPWDGWAYDTFLADLVADPGQSAATLAASIVARYGQSYGGAETLSAVDVPAAAALAGELDAFAAAVIAADEDWDAISFARSESDYFTDSDYRDLGTFLDGVVAHASNPDIVSAATGAQSAYAAAVLANHSGPGEGGTGLSVYLPAQGGSVSGAYTPAGFDLLADTRWEEFLAAFVASSSAGTDQDGCIADAGAAGTPPVTIGGNVGFDGIEGVGGRDVDFYALAVAPDEQIGFDVDAEETGGSLDSILRLFDAGGVELAYNDDAYDPDTNAYSFDSYIEHTFTKAETVYIAVSGYANGDYDPTVPGSGVSGSTGAYDLLIRQLGAAAPDINGTIPTATAVGSAPSSYAAAIGDEDIGDRDVDFYAVDVESGQSLTLNAAAGGSGLDACLQLFTAGGDLLASDDDTHGADPEIDYDFSALGAGTYYVAVSGAPNTTYDPFVLGGAVPGSTGAYTLSVAGYSVHLDFDGVIPRARPLGSPPADAAGAIGDEPAGALDVDFYAVDVGAGQTVGFDVDADELGTGLDAVLRLFSAAGSQLAVSDDATDPDSGLATADPYIRHTFAAAGTCYVAVSGAPNDAYGPFAEASGTPGDQGDYDLRIRSLGGADDPNGTLATADPVALPSVVSAAVGDEPADNLDVDVYAFNALAGQTVGFDVDAEENGSTLDSILRLFDAGGVELAYNDDAPDPDSGYDGYDSHLMHTFAADGTFYVAVSGYPNGDYDPAAAMSGQAGSIGTYELRVAPQPAHVGPDAFGYLGYPVDPGFEDISGTGAAGLTPPADDDVFALSPADLPGFAFDFYGTTHSALYVSSNGLITFGAANDDYANDPLAAEPDEAAVAVLWDDLVVEDTQAAVLWELRGAGDQQRLIVQWQDAGYYGGGGPITFQAVLDETDDSIRLNYLDLGGAGGQGEGASATVGVKDAGDQSAGGRSLQISFDAGPNVFVGSGLSTRVATEALPDLTLGGVTYPAGTHGPGTTIDAVSAWAVNAGTADGGAFAVEVRLSDDSIWSADDVTVYSAAEPTLAADAGREVGGPALIPPGTPAGSYHVLVMVDAAGEHDESRELNNVWASAVADVVVPPDPDPPTVAGCACRVRANYGATWHARLTTVFSEDVIVSEAHVTVLDAADGVVDLEAVGYDGDTRALTVDASGLDADGEYVLRLDPGITDMALNPLDGNADGVGGDGHDFAFRRLTGDATGDGTVDVLDLARLANHFGQTGAGWADGDFNADANVDVLDLAAIANHFGEDLSAGAAGRTGERSAPPPPPEARTPAPAAAPTPEARTLSPAPAHEAEGDLAPAAAWQVHDRPAASPPAPTRGRREGRAGRQRNVEQVWPTYVASSIGPVCSTRFVWSVGQVFPNYAAPGPAGEAAPEPPAALGLAVDLLAAPDLGAVPTPGI